MKLITFQPLKVLRALEEKNEYIPDDNKLLGKRVFCIKLDENTMENLFMTAPSMPQVLIELDVDDSEVEVLDYLEWVNYLNGHRKYTGKYASKVKYKEYAIKSIKTENVINTRIICDSDNEDLVQDKFMDTHYEDLEKLSGFKWKRNNDACMIKFWSSPEAVEFVRKVTKCMMPMETLTDKELEDAHELIRKTYRI